MEGLNGENVPRWVCGKNSVAKMFICNSNHYTIYCMELLDKKKTKQREFSDHCVPHFKQFWSMSCATPSFYQSGRQFPFFHTKAFDIKQSLKKTKRQQMPEPWRDEWKLFLLANFCITFKGEHLDKDKSWNMLVNVSFSMISALILPVAGLFVVVVVLQNIATF